MKNNRKEHCSRPVVAPSEPQTIHMEIASNPKSLASHLEYASDDEHAEESSEEGVEIYMPFPLHESQITKVVPPEKIIISNKSVSAQKLARSMSSNGDFMRTSPDFFHNNPDAYQRETKSCPAHFSSNQSSKKPVPATNQTSFLNTRPNSTLMPVASTKIEKSMITAIEALTEADSTEDSSAGLACVLQ